MGGLFEAPVYKIRKCAACAPKTRHIPFPSDSDVCVCVCVCTSRAHIIAVFQFREQMLGIVNTGA